jgi:hypothetical protein
LLATSFRWWERAEEEFFLPAFGRLTALIPSASADGIPALDARYVPFESPAMAEALQRSRLEAGSGDLQWSLSPG